MLIKVFKDFSLGSALLFLLGSFILYGCTGGSPSGPSPMASVRMAIYAPPKLFANSEILSTATITISASDITTITKTLYSSPWTATIHVAAGSNRKIEVVAITNLSNQYYGTETVNLTAGKTTTVTIKLTLNNNPVIDSITFGTGTNVIPASGTTTMTCNASDPDGDTLSYTWSVTKGTLSSAITKTTTITTNTTSASGAITVKCMVSDGKGGTDSQTTTVTASGAATFAPISW